MGAHSLTAEELDFIREGFGQALGFAGVDEESQEFLASISAKLA